VLLTSPAALAELFEVLDRPKFDRYVNPEQRLDFAHAYLHRAETVQPTTTLTACRDPDDKRLLELALNGHADLLVTGDDDLLALAGSSPFRIVTPRHYVDEFVDSPRV
jgi:uncharacterized protein